MTKKPNKITPPKPQIFTDGSRKFFFKNTKLKVKRKQNQSKIPVQKTLPLIITIYLLKRSLVPKCTTVAYWKITDQGISLLRLMTIIPQTLLSVNILLFAGNKYLSLFLVSHVNYILSKVVCINKITYLIWCLIILLQICERNWSSKFVHFTPSYIYGD